MEQEQAGSSAKGRWSSSQGFGEEAFPTQRLREVTMTEGALSGWREREGMRRLKVHTLSSLTCWSS